MLRQPRPNDEERCPERIETSRAVWKNGLRGNCQRDQNLESWSIAGDTLETKAASFQTGGYYDFTGANLAVLCFRQSQERASWSALEIALCRRTSKEKSKWL